MTVVENPRLRSEENVRDPKTRVVFDDQTKRKIEKDVRLNERSRELRFKESSN